MSIMDEVQRLARHGNPGEGIALIARSASDGDGEALFILANWRLWGLYGPRDPAAAVDLLARAEAAGWAEALPLRATLIGNGTSGPADPQRARKMLQPLAASDPAIAEQLGLLDAIKERPCVIDTLSADPDIRIARSFLSLEECGYLMRKAEPALRPSMIIDDATRRPVPHPVRTSFSMNFDPASEDLVVHAINRRIAELTGTDVRSGEPLHILRYSPGQEFRPHLDAMPGETNQREWTALVYLNQGYEGGATVFPDLGISAKGSAGDCLIFRVCDPAGEADLRLKHAGEPVTGGIKWLASRWIRRHAYVPEIARG
jgi:prolyl 4-hydroxylase